MICSIIISRIFQNMSFDKIKSFLRTASEITQQPSSLIDRTSSFISNSFRRNIVPTASTAEFDQYLASLPTIKRVSKKIKSSSSASLKPQLYKRCLQIVDKDYFNDKYEIDHTFFDKRKKTNQQRQVKMHEQLDQVEVCLFNQITSRFDEILSVLRTIQSLDCLVVQNQNKLKIIRQDNFQKVIMVSQKQNRLVKLINRKKNIEKSLKQSTKLRQFDLYNSQYQKFNELQDKIDSPDTVQVYYSLIPTIKANIQTYKKFKATQHANIRIDQMEGIIKRSFSDKINEKIFEYLKKDIPYQTQFWRKHIHNRGILQQKDDKENSIALLDQSNFMGQQQSAIIILPKKQQSTQNSIIQFIKNGWENGQYSIDKLKEDLDILLKSKHNSFMLDFRNFCDEICKKYERSVDNPSLSNLLGEISITFCSKVYGYFFDIHKSMILRFFSLCKKVFESLISLDSNNLSIDQKCKIDLIAEGFANSGAYLVRVIVQKLVNIQETKLVHSAMDISEIKQVVSVLENAEAFLEQQIDISIAIPEASLAFLKEFFESLKEKYPTKLLQTAKKRKLMDYLNKIHKNSLTVELKQRLENEVWVATDIPTFYYDSLHYLITGESLNLRRNKHNLKNQQSSMMYETSVLMDGLKGEQSFFQEPTKLIGNFRIIRNDITINGQTYKVTETLLLLLEILEDYMTLAQNFPIIKSEVGIRINQLIRSYNVSSCELIIHAKAIGFQKIKSKMITSRHLALSSLCLKFILYIMDCIEKRVEIMDVDKLKQSVEEHFDMIIKKLNQILIFKSNSAKSEINLNSTPSKGTESIVSNTKILFEILSQYYDKQILAKIFTKESFNIYLDAISAIKINNRVQAQALKDDVAFYYSELKALEGLTADFQESQIAAEDVVRRAFEQL